MNETPSKAGYRVYDTPTGTLTVPVAATSDDPAERVLASIVEYRNAPLATCGTPLSKTSPETSDG